MFENFTRKQTAIIADALTMFLESEEVGARGDYRREIYFLRCMASVAAVEKADSES